MADLDLLPPGRIDDVGESEVPQGTPATAIFQSDTLGSAVGAHYWLAALPDPMSVWTGERTTAGSGRRFF